MPLKIASVDPEGLASRYGVQAGDSILKINSQAVNDFFDLEYYGSDHLLELSLQDAQGRKRQVRIVRDSFLPLGIEPEEHRISRCRNHCVFCFIDQMPPGLRSSLYVKDDDYLYSRDHGNYITLTNLSEADLKRIVRQHISPLYISVHTTNNELRRRMMGYRNDMDVMAVLKRLSRAGIGFHTQIVCVPGYNDGAELERSVNELLRPGLGTLSLGVVPVGLTRFRDKLPELKPFDASSAKALIEQIDKLRKQQGGDILYAADEFYVLSGKRLPPPDYYQDYPQAENGIGLLSLLRWGFSRHRKAFVQELESRPGNYIMLHSRAAAKEMARIVKRLGSVLTASTLQAKEIRNHFMGPHISVSGLLTASDICLQHGSTSKDILILPGSMFNEDGLTLDGMSAASLKKELRRDLLIVDPLFDGWSWV